MSKENLHFDDQSKQVDFSFFCETVFSKRNKEKHVFLVSIELKKHSCKSGRTRKTVKTLAYLLDCSHSISRSLELTLLGCVLEISIV